MRCDSSYPQDTREDRVWSRENTSWCRELISPHPAIGSPLNILFLLWESRGNIAQNVSLEDSPHCPASPRSSLTWHVQSSTLPIVRYFSPAVFTPLITLLTSPQKQSLLNCFQTLFLAGKIGREVYFRSSWAKFFNSQNLPSHSNQLENTLIF